MLTTLTTVLRGSISIEDVRKKIWQEVNAYQQVALHSWPDDEEHASNRQNGEASNRYGGSSDMGDMGEGERPTGPAMKWRRGGDSMTEVEGVGLEDSGGGEGMAMDDE